MWIIDEENVNDDVAPTSDEDEADGIAHGGVIEQQAEIADDSTAAVQIESARALLSVLDAVRRNPTDDSFNKLLRLILNDEFELPPNMPHSMYGLRGAVASPQAAAKSQVMQVSVHDTTEPFSGAQLMVPVRRFEDIEPRAERQAHE